VIDQTKARKALYRNGWVVGTLAAFVIIFVFFAYCGNVRHPMDELLIVGVPIGIALGALVGLTVEDSASSRKRRNAIALVVLAVFAAYLIALVLYLMSRV